MLKRAAPYALFALCTAASIVMALSWPRVAAAQVKISSLPVASALGGGELLPAVQSGSNVVLTPAQIAVYDAAQLFSGGIAGKCAQWVSASVLGSASAPCGSGGGGGTPGGSSGQIQYNNAGAFGGLAVTGSGNVALATSPTLVTPNLGTPSAVVLTNATGLPNASVIGLGTFATANAATPPAIGGTTPAAGAFTTLSVSGNLTTNVTGSAASCLQANTSGVVSGTGSACGGGGSSGANPTGTVGLTAVNGVATTFLRSDGAPALSQSISPTWTGTHTFNGTVAGTALSTYLASPPAIGGSAAAAITGTTITATTGLSGPHNGTVGATTPASGAFTSINDSALTASVNVCADGSKNLTSSCTNEVAIANLAQIGANTVLGNFSGSTANVAAQTVPGCVTAGTYLQYTAGTGLSCSTLNAQSASKPANPTSTLSTTLVMAGLAGSFTPATTGRALITITGDAYNTTAAVFINLGMYYGTSGAPANGAAVTGTLIGSAIRFKPGVGTGSAIPFSMTYALTGLTPATAYWLDLGFDTSNGSDAANLENISIVAVEF